MRLEEIITNPPRDEYLDQYWFNFQNAVPVAKVKNLILKKDATGSEIHYGLFTGQDALVGYLSLEKFNGDIWQATLSQLANAYKGQGFGTFLYDYAVMNDKLKVMSDETNTGGPHGSRNLWLRLRDNRRYKVVGYNIDTNEVFPNATPEMIFDEEPNTRWLALPPGETINETLIRIQRNMRERYVVWYGPGTTTETYFNF
jgi:hypothetical protein